MLRFKIDSHAEICVVGLLAQFWLSPSSAIEILNIWQ